jgi:uncharacterized protein (DUF1697 family)
MNYSYIAFLRAINVGGRVVKMELLRQWFSEQGFTNVSTFIASGNVLFCSDNPNTEQLTTQIEQKLKTVLGYDVETFIRTRDEVIDIARYKPFADSVLKTALALNVAFIKKPLDVAQIQVLMGLSTDIDHFHTHQREVYWLCEKKQSESKFSNVVFEKAIKTKATFRGMNTVRKIIGL